MSAIPARIPGRLPAAGPRNGLPERVNYTYKGTGHDILAPRVAIVPASRRKAPSGDGWCPDCEYRLESIGHEISCGDGTS